MSPDWITLSVNMMVLMAIIFASEHFIKNKDREIALLERACEGYSVRLSKALEEVEVETDRRLTAQAEAERRETVLRFQRDQLANAYLTRYPFIDAEHYRLKLDQKLNDGIDDLEEEDTYG